MTRLTYAMVIGSIAACLLGARAQEAKPPTELERFKQETAQNIARLRQTNAKALQAQQEMFQKLAGDLQAYGETIRTQNTQIERLQAALEKLQAENQRLSAEIDAQRQELDRRGKNLNEALALEAAARLAADKSIAEKLGQELANAIDAIQKSVPPPPKPPEPPAAAKTYTVQKGDTLSAIAKAFNVTVAQLQEINEIEGDVIYVGKTLKLPGPP